MVLTKLKERAEIVLNRKVNKAVITIPAHFNIDQRQATRNAGKIAGLEVLRIINEPTAAALAFELDNRFRNEKSNVLIYDFGGGTFDVSIVTLENGVVEVIATDGDPFLGGDDIDLQVAKYILEEYEKEQNINLLQKIESGECLAQTEFRRLLQQAEKTKITLSEIDITEIELASFYRKKDLEFSLTRTKFEEISKNLFKRSMDCVKKTLKDAGLEKEDIDEVVLVGGTTRIPYIKQMLENYFNKKVNASVHPDQAVAQGAARLAAIITDPNYCKEKPLRLFDVCSLSLGINIVGGVMSPIIHRNTKLPAEFSDFFANSEDNQDAIQIDIYEGERPMTCNNRKLSSTIITGIKKAPKGESEVTITFNLDEDGILKVIAKETNGDAESELIVDMNSFQLSDEAIDKMIKQANSLKKIDEEVKNVAKLKIEVHDYCEVIKKRLSDENLINEKNIDDTKKKEIEIKVKEMSDWINSQLRWASHDISKKFEELKIFCDPFLE